MTNWLRWPAAASLLALPLLGLAAPALAGILCSADCVVDGEGPLRPDGAPYDFELAIEAGDVSILDVVTQGSVYLRAALLEAGSIALDAQSIEFGDGITVEADTVEILADVAWPAEGAGLHRGGAVLQEGGATVQGADLSLRAGGLPERLESGHGGIVITRPRPVPGFIEVLAQAERLDIAVVRADGSVEALSVATDEFRGLEQAPESIRYEATGDVYLDVHGFVLDSLSVQAAGSIVVAGEPIALPEPVGGLALASLMVLASLNRRPRLGPSGRRKPSRRSRRQR